MRGAAPPNIRILTAPSSSYPTLTPSTDDSPWLPDGNPPYGAMRTNPAVATLGESLSKALVSSTDVDWTKIAFPWEQG